MTSPFVRSVSTSWTVWAEVRDCQAMLYVHALGDKRAVARLRVALDAEERDHRSDREVRHQGAEIEGVENLAGVAVGVRGRQRDAVALAHPLAVVFAVLELAQLGRRRQPLTCR